MACSRGPISRDQLDDAIALARTDAINAARDEGREPLRRAIAEGDTDEVHTEIDTPSPAADRAAIWLALRDYEVDLDAAGWHEDRR